MRSIIDEIAQAEGQADEIRRQAVAAGRERIAAVREESEKALAAMDETERDALRDALETAEREGEAEAKTLLASLHQEADALCARAEARLDDTVDYLLNRVRSEV